VTYLVHVARLQGGTVTYPHVVVKPRRNKGGKEDSTLGGKAKKTVIPVLN